MKKAASFALGCKVNQYESEAIAELFAVADAGLLMPPKSTWFEPKLRSGIFIHRLQPEVWASRQDFWRSKLDCNRGATGVTET